MYDPYTGEWVEDDEYGSALYGELGPDSFGGYMLPDYSTGGYLQATDAATQGRMLGNMSKLNAILRDPFFNYRVALETGQNTFPFEQLMMPGNPWLQDPTGLGGSGSAQDYAALTGAGGTGGSGGGGGGRGLPPGSYMDPETGEMVVPTPVLSSTLQSSNPVLREAASLIAEGTADPASLIATVYAQEADPDLRKVYSDSINKMFEEATSAQLARSPAGAGVGKPSTLAETAAKWGVVDPLSTYSADNLPPDIASQLSPYLSDPAAVRRAATAADVASKVFERDAVYAPMPSEGFGVRLPENEVRRESGGVREPGTNRWLPNQVAAEGRDAAAQFVENLPVGFEGETGGAGHEWLTNVINPDGSIGPPLANTQPNPYLPDTTPEQAAPPNSGFMRSIARQAQERKSRGLPEGVGLVDFLSSPEGREVRNNPRGPVITRNGRQVRTNSAGVQAQRKRQNAEYLRGSGPQDRDRAIQDAVGRRLQRQGRTPQRDAMRVTTDYLRAMGIAI